MSDEQREEPRGEIGRKVFLFLLREGGWWTVPEIRASTGLDRLGLTPRIGSLVDAGSLVRRETETRIEFAVKASCIVPMSVTIADLQRAGAAVKIGEAA